MPRKTLVILLACALAGCSASGAITYLHQEYGSAQKDGVVEYAETGQPAQFDVWLNKTKPRILVNTNAFAAAGVGVVAGASYGVVDAAPLQSMFADAALRYLHEHGRKGCKLSDPYKVHAVSWEFGYVCA